MLDKIFCINTLLRHSVPKEVDFPRYIMKRVITCYYVLLRGIFHAVSCFPLHFMLQYIAEIWITFRKEMFKKLYLKTALTHMIYSRIDE